MRMNMISEGVTPSASRIPVNHGPASRIPLNFELESRILIDKYFEEKAPLELPMETFQVFAGCVLTVFVNT